MMPPAVDLLKSKSLWARWDAAVTKFVLGTFEAAGSAEIRTPSVITKDLPLVKTPTILVTAILGYLTTILGTLMWRSMAKNSNAKQSVKKPDSAWLRRFMLFHNVFLMGLSTFMFAGTVQQARKYGYSLWGNIYNPEQTEMAYMIYIFYLSKIYEFNDTFIMLLKGNIHQVSFLHVYHHISISIIWWFLAYTVPGGDTYYPCALNSFVHILMYTYYLLALVVGKDPQKRKKYLWWGKHMTLFQMAQFLSMTAQSVYCYFLSEFPRFLSVLLFLYMQTLLVLFGNFFLRKHILKPKDKSNKES